MPTGTRRVIIDRRFCGPPDSGNGGYSAGLLAATLGGAVEVTLRRPPPLARELTLSVEGDGATLRDEELLIAEARVATLALTPPAAPAFEKASELSARYVGHAQHHFPGCFVCGPARAVGDGLRIFPGREAPEQPVSAPWVPDASLVDESGRVPAAIAWAALDCVGYFAVAAPDHPVALLGRMTAELTGELPLGERCVVLGWSLGREGRKLQAGTALYDSHGHLRGIARQTWLSIP